MAEFKVEIDLAKPTESYTDIMRNYLQSTEELDEEEYRARYLKISEAAREMVWNILFGDLEVPYSAAERRRMAGDLLKAHKKDAAFHNPFEYNEYIVKVREELLKRHMFEFWRNEMVAKELGPCWARDSDYFDDMYDTEPAKFYEYAGCKAPFQPWQRDDDENALPLATNQLSINEYLLELPTSETSTTSDETVVSVKKIGDENPVQDYLSIMANFKDHFNQVKKVHKEVQAYIWNKLFNNNEISKEDFKKVGALLIEYRKDACFDDPFTYNEWIHTVRDELFERRMVKFWKFIVENQLGIISHVDSDYFEDSNSTAHIDFLQSGNIYLNQH